MTTPEERATGLALGLAQQLEVARQDLEEGLIDRGQAMLILQRARDTAYGTEPDNGWGHVFSPGLGELCYEDPETGAKRDAGKDLEAADAALDAALARQDTDKCPGAQPAGGMHDGTC